MAKNSEKISVLIPMYNTERYFPRCIESIINQTYKNLEIIIVDDGSEDRSRSVAEQYAAKDERIQLICQKNGGNASARNTALKNAAGDWLLFVDSDDYIAETHIELLYKSAKTNKADIATCQYQVYEWDYPQKAVDKNKTEIKNTNEALKALFYQKNITTGPVCKLFRKELFDGITFPVGQICEDLATIYKVFAKAKKIAMNTQISYFYLTNPSSTMNKQIKNFRPERAVALDFCEEAIKFVDGNFPDLHTAAVNRLFTEAIYIFTDLPQTKECANIMKRVWDTIKRYRNDVIADPESKENIRKYAKISKAGRRTLRTTLHAKNKIGNYLGARQRKKTAITA